MSKVIALMVVVCVLSLGVLTGGASAATPLRCVERSATPLFVSPAKHRVVGFARGAVSCNRRVALLALVVRIWRIDRSCPCGSVLVGQRAWVNRNASSVGDPRRGVYFISPVVPVRAGEEYWSAALGSWDSGRSWHEGSTSLLATVPRFRW